MGDDREKIHDIISKLTEHFREWVKLSKKKQRMYRDIERALKEKKDDR